MAKSVFPKKFDASIKEHMHFLKKEYSGVHNSDVLELAAGSGHLAEILPCDNRYKGIDISEGLLKIACKKFKNAEFKNFELIQ